MSKTILNHLDDFLKKRIRIEPGYERAKVSPEDFAEFEELLRLIIEAKWESSYSGDYPIEASIVNRSTHERLHFQPLPYENSIEKLHTANMNLGIAVNQVDMAIRTLK